MAAVADGGGKSSGGTPAWRTCAASVRRPGGALLCLTATFEDDRVSSRDAGWTLGIGPGCVEVALAVSGGLSSDRAELSVSLGSQAVVGSRGLG